MPGQQNGWQTAQRLIFTTLELPGHMQAFRGFLNLKSGFDSPWAQAGLMPVRGAAQLGATLRTALSGKMLLRLDLTKPPQLVMLLIPIHHLMWKNNPANAGHRGSSKIHHGRT